jgi:hypothetical protein
VCLAGQAALYRPTSWAAALRLRGGFVDLGPGALALINLELLRQLPARPSLPQAIEALGRPGVTAIAVRGRVEPNELPIASRLTQRWSCVLLQLRDSNEGAVSLGGEGDFLSDQWACCLRARMEDVPLRRGRWYSRC